jgi:hypothetical protein
MSVITPTSLSVELPPDPQLLRVLRLMVSGLASLAHFDLAATEEIRVAIDELGTTLIAASDGSSITLTIEVTATALCVEGSTAMPAAVTSLEVDPLVDRMLGVVASTHSWSSDDGRATGRFEKELPVD